MLTIEYLEDKLAEVKVMQEYIRMNDVFGKRKEEIDDIQVMIDDVEEAIRQLKIVMGK